MFYIRKVSKLPNAFSSLSEPEAVCSSFRHLLTNTVGIVNSKHYLQTSIFLTKMQQNNKDEYSNPYPDFDEAQGHGILDIPSKKVIIAR